MTQYENIRLEFLLNDADEEDGLGHAGIETYRDEPYAGTAREVGQNSRDASRSLPVRISFDLLELKTSDLPDVESLKGAIDAGLKKGQQANDQKEIAFFQQAQRVVRADHLKVLRISDSNTTGVRGPATTGTPFHSLVKGAGVSKKESDTSGGSFGIGKNAVYAISDLQTVFYSTNYVNEETGKTEFLAQGKTILVSHTDSDGKARRGYGYWGGPRYTAIEGKEKVPPWLRRDDVGTSVFAIGFRESSDWRNRIAYSLVQNFFYAIHAGEMEFAIDNSNIVVSKESLLSLFESPELLATAIENDRETEFSFSHDLYKCLTSSDAKEHVVDLAGLGQVKIRVLVAEELPKKVCIIRNGMVITDSLEHFGDKFARFKLHRDFIALAVPLDDQGRALIKRLENPTHNGLSAERLPDRSQRERAKSIMKSLARAVRDVIKTYTLMQFESEVSADEMRKYFEVAAETSPDKSQSSQDDPTTITYVLDRNETIGPHAPALGKGTAGGPKPGPTPGPKPTPMPTRRRSGPRPRGTGGAGRSREVLLQEVRNFVGSDGDPKKRVILFTPSESGEIDIALDGVGLNDNVELNVVKASGAAISGGRLRQAVVGNVRTRIEVEFDEVYVGPIEIRASIHSAVGGAP